MPSIPPHPQDLTSLLREAMRQAPGVRAAWLRERCEGHPALLAAVQRAFAEQESHTLQDGAADPPPAAPPGWPSRLGNYRVLGVLGEGGMGVVYLAEQDRPRRTVALKVIRPGLLTPKLLRRFELETQTMARLQHPGIAQVFDAGTLDVGGHPQPYFAMEYVAGRTLNGFAAANGLDVASRIRLFNKVCDAVQHAHQRGVIHRDLKSSNIVVTAEGEPKVLDFGVAKLSDADGSAGATLRTDVGQIVGTVPYMSPEQIAGRPDDIDTRSDVYTLGVVLYELLCGQLPHLVHGRTLVEASRIIVDQEAPRLGLMDGDFRGDLEVIVAKAIEKDRNRRYQSPAELAGDLERYLNDEPILARPPSTLYQLSKFARRNRPVVVAGGVAAVMLVLGAAGVSWQAIEATRGRNLARQMQRAADEAKVEAVKEARKAKEINALLTEMLQTADPDVSLGREVTVLEVLDRTAASLSESLNDPGVVASVRSTLAATYQSLNQLEAAERQATTARDILARELGPDAPETMEAQLNLANVYADQGRFDEAKPLADDVLKRTEARFGRGAPDTVPGMIVLSRVLHESGQIKEGRAVLDAALETARRTLGEDHRDTMYAMHNKASALKDDAAYDEAIAMFRRVIELRRRVFGPNHSQTLSSMNNLAGTLQKAGRNEEALESFRQIYEIRKAIFGPRHSTTLNTLSNMAVCLTALKRPTEAEPLVREALEGFLATVGEDHNKTLITMANLAYIEEDLGDLDEAERLYRRVIEIRTRGANPNVPELLSVMNNLAMLMMTRGNATGSAEVFADLDRRARASLPDGHFLTAIFANNYGDCLTTLGRFGEARELLTESLGVLARTLGPKHERTEKARTRLTRLEEMEAQASVRPPAKTVRSPAADPR